MADIITKLLLNDKDYSSKLDKAKRSAKGYKSEMDGLGKSIGGGITKAFGAFAAAVGVAGGAVEVFSKTIKSSQTASDVWDQTIRAAKNSVDTFFTALSTGDFSGFLGGLNAIIDRAKQASIALDALGNAQMSYSYFTTANQADFSEAMTVMRDQSASYGDRIKAKQTAEAILGDQQELVTELHQKVVTAVQSVLGESNYLTTEKISREDINKILRLDISQMGEEDKARFEAEYQQYLKEVSAIPKPQNQRKLVGGTQYGQPIYVNVGPKKEEMDAYNTQLTSIADKYKLAVLYNTMLVKMTDEQLQNVIQMTNQMDSADNQLASMQKQLNRVKIEAPKVETDITPVTDIIPVKVPEADNAIYRYFTNTNQASFSRAMTVMRDQDASYDDRAKARQTAETILGNQQDLVTELRKKITTALQSVLSESNYLTAEQISRVDIDKILHLEFSQNGEDGKARLEDEYQQYLKEVSAIPKPQVGRQEDMDEYNAQLAAVTDKYKDAVLYNTMLVQLTNEQLQNLIQMVNQMDSADDQLADMQTQFSKVKIEEPRVESADMDVATDLPAAEMSDVNTELQQTAKISSDATTEVTALASAMSSLGDIVSDDAQNWLAWGANVVSAVANAIPAFEAAAMASRSKATADSASAVAGGASAVANIPYAGPALAVAAALSIAAAIAAAPQFATGGVVGGTSFTGDNVLARVNSQEMILTREQQNILSDRLTSAGDASQVRFVIEGNNLVGVINNWNRYNARRS